MTKAKAITNDITQNISTQKMLFRILIISLASLFVVYLYLIGSITFNVIARKTLEKTVIDLNGQVNRLEFTYLNGINEINEDYAKSKGFVDVHQNIFVARDINHVAIR